MRYAARATEAAQKSGKHLKDTEILLRATARRLDDVGRTLNFDDRPYVEAAVKQVEKLAPAAARPHVRRALQGEQAVRRRSLVSLALCIAALAASAQVHRHDPLTSPETDALREVSMLPEQKLPLYLKYARARLASIEQLRSDPHAARGARPQSPRSARGL